jgi:eukaryotic-like serine/threonine-protein kinase
VSDRGRLVADRYRILDRIGRGGMATVWRAHDDLLGRLVAVKKLHPQPHLDDNELARLFERARREARSAARISHRNVVVVHDVVADEGLPTIIMEYVPSINLADLIEAHGPVPLEEVARIGRGVIAALRAAHRAGVLHRDVKPANVLLAEDGRVVLTDFGIAQVSEASHLTRTGHVVGSLDFVSPERLVGGTAGPEADLWALGATLFQAVEGRSPFLRDTLAQTMYAIVMAPAPEARGAGPLTPLIQGLLVGKPAERLSAEEAERLLRIPVGAAGPVAAGPVAAPPAVLAVPGDAPIAAAQPGPGPEPQPGLHPARETNGAPPADGPVEGPLPTTTGLKAQRSWGRSRKSLVLAASVAAAIVIAIALLLTSPTEKYPADAMASDGPQVTDDNTARQSTDPSAPSSTDTSAPALAPSPPDPPQSVISGATSRATAPAASQSASGAAQVAPEPEYVGEDTATQGGSDASAAPVGRALVGAASGKCLSGGAGTEGIQLFQDICDGSAAQRWQAGSDGTLRSAGKCMTAAGGATGNRTEIQLAVCNGSAAQQVRLVGTRLIADQSQKCVDIFGGASGTGAVLFKCNGRDNQTWTPR